jgi:hypothetical protein
MLARFAGRTCKVLMYLSPIPRRLLAAAILLMLAAGATSAAEMSFYAKNHHPFAVAVELFGRDRVWPGDDQVYWLDGKERKSVPITCVAGETICYGAWISGAAGTSWGVGPDNNRDCTKCCSICTDRGSMEIELGP